MQFQVLLCPEAEALARRLRVNVKKIIWSLREKLGIENESFELQIFARDLPHFGDIGEIIQDSPLRKFRMRVKKEMKTAEDFLETVLHEAKHLGQLLKKELDFKGGFVYWKKKEYKLAAIPYSFQGWEREANDFAARNLQAYLKKEYFFPNV